MAKKNIKNTKAVHGGQLMYNDGGNLFFLGGNVTQNPNNKLISGGTSIGMGLATGNPMAIATGAMDFASGHIQNVKSTFNDKNASLFEKGLSVVSPIAGSIFGNNARNEQAQTDEFNNSIQERNNMLGIKANGGKVNTRYNVKDSSPFTNYYNEQSLYTGALANKYPNVPIEDILTRSANTPFNNANLNRTADSLTAKYGDVRLNENEVDSLIKNEGYPNIFNTDRQIKDYDTQGAGRSTNTKGSKEDEIGKFGWRMAMQRSYPQGSYPYKYLDNQKANGGFIIPSGVPNNTSFNYAEGGMLTEFNNGGSHEINPNQGVMQGVAPDGTPNKVEQGETKWQDYIFSDRLLIDKQAVQDHNLPKHMEGKSFADMSKKMSKIHKERPNDPISRDTMRSNMTKLMSANDDVRQYQEGGMMAGGGKLYKDGDELDLLMNKGSKYNPNNFILPEVQPNTIYKDNPLSFNDNIQMFGDFPSGILSASSITNNVNEQPFFKDSKNLRYAPIAFDALAATGLFGKSPKPTTYNPTTIQQQGQLQAPRVDEQTMRANIDTAYQNQIRGMADASGGSASALRAGLTGVGADYMSAVGQGFLGANTANNQAKMQADQYNLGTQANIASQNAQMQNQAGMYNNQLQNQNRTLNYDTRMSYLGKGAEGLGDVGYEQRNADIMKKIYGYDQYGNYRPLNPSERQTTKAMGGRLKLIRRSK